MADQLLDKVLIVTGASSGIGAATAVEAGRAGVRVVVAARRREKLEEVAEQIRVNGGQVLVVPTDVGDPLQVREMIDRTLKQFGRVDVLFANAGFGHFHRFLDESHTDIERQMWRVNYFGAMECIRVATQAMIRNDFAPGHRGHVLICSSIVGLSGLPYYGSYAATKGALHALACSLRCELAEHGIQVTTVYPVGTDTGFSDAVRQMSGTDSTKSNTPQALMQSSEHVARRVVACLGRRSPPPEVWPSRLGHLGAAIWTLFPRLRTYSFRGNARTSRRMLEAVETPSNGSRVAAGQDRPAH